MTDRIEVRGTTRVDVRTADVQVENRGTPKVEIRDGGLPGAAGVMNVFIQPTAPVTLLDQYLWIETSADEGTVRTFWVET